jgi:hypothetical protein
MTGNMLERASANSSFDKDVLSVVEGLRKNKLTFSRLFRAKPKGL